MLNQFFIGGALIVTTVFVHAVILEVIIKALIAVRTDIEFRWRAVVFALVILAVFIAHVIEIWIWAALYYFEASISEIPTLEAAVYFSTSSFTTVGFGDLVLSEDWRLLSSIEAINGMILFGWSTAFIFAVIRRVYSQIYPAAAES
jgi:ABC-type sugar transport system permease subunit